MHAGANATGIEVTDLISGESALILVQKEHIRLFHNEIVLQGFVARQAFDNKTRITTMKKKLGLPETAKKFWPLSKLLFDVCSEMVTNYIHRADYQLGEFEGMTELDDSDTDFDEDMGEMLAISALKLKSGGLAHLRLELQVRGVTFNGNEELLRKDILLCYCNPKV
jgi:hypothetical protein